MYCVQPCSSGQVFVASHTMQTMPEGHDEGWTTSTTTTTTTQFFAMLWARQGKYNYDRHIVVASTADVRTTRIGFPHPSLIATLSQHHECMYVCTASLSLTHDPIVISLSYIIIMDTMYNPASHAQHWSIHPSIHPFIHLPTYTYLPS